MRSEVDTYAEDLDAQAVAAQKPSEQQFVEEEFEDELPEDDSAYDAYRSLSIAAVASFVFGVLSILMLPVIAVAGILLVVPVMGTLLGLFATWTVVSRPEEFIGKRMAMTGMLLSVVMFVAGGALNYQLNKIEVPEQYADNEIHFWELQPEVDIDMNYINQFRGRYFELPLPERAMELDGQKVFITGYVYPGDQKTGLDKFVMVPDKGTCCFGGQPNLTDMIEVKLAEPLRIDYSMWRRGVGGTLRVHKTIQSRQKLTGVIYQLEADYLSEGPGVTGSAGG